MEAVPEARGEKRGERVSKSGVGAERTDREKGVKIAKIGGKGIHYPNHYTIRVQAVGLYVESLGNLIHVQ